MTPPAKESLASAATSWPPPASAGTDRPALAAAILWLLLAIFLGLRTLPLFEPDEGRYAATAHHMVTSGDWIMPVFDGDLRLNKPPLTYWLIGAAEMLLGKCELAARLPSALASLGTAWFAFVLGRRLAGRRAAARTVLVLASCPLFLAAAHLATTDALLLCFETAAMAAAARALDGADDEPRGRSALRLGVPLGLAVLTKGPVGLLAPALAILAGAWAAGWLSRLGRLAPLRTLVLAILPAGAYYAVLYQRLQSSGDLPDALALLSRETWGRVAKGYAHDQPLFYYAWVILAGAFPWHADLPAAFVRARRDPRPFRRFLLGWLVSLPVLFSLARGKLSFYVLPILPALAALAAETWVARTRAARDAPSRRGWGWSILVGAAPILAAVAFGIFLARPHAATTPLRLGIGFALAAPLAAASAWLSWRGRTGGSRAAWIGAAACLLLQLVPVARDDTRLLTTSREAARAALAVTPEGTPIAGFDTRRWPGFLYYVGGERFEILGTFAALELFAENPGAATILYRTEHEDRVRKILGDRLTPLQPTILGTEPFTVGTLAPASSPAGR